MEDFYKHCVLHLLALQVCDRNSFQNITFLRDLQVYLTYMLCTGKFKTPDCFTEIFNKIYRMLLAPLLKM